MRTPTQKCVRRLSYNRWPIILAFRAALFRERSAACCHRRLLFFLISPSAFAAAAATCRCQKLQAGVGGLGVKRQLFFTIRPDEGLLPATLPTYPRGLFLYLHCGISIRSYFSYRKLPVRRANPTHRFRLIKATMKMWFQFQVSNSLLVVLCW